MSIIMSLGPFAHIKANKLGAKQRFCLVAATRQAGLHAPVHPQGSLLGFPLGECQASGLATHNSAFGTYLVGQNVTSSAHDPFSDWAALLNRPVYSSDRKKIGFLRKVLTDYIVVKKGLVSLSNYIIPKSLAES